METADLIELLKPTYTDKYYIHNNGIKQILLKISNEKPDILNNRFNSKDELYDFILYTEFMIYGNDDAELDEIKTVITFKPYFRGLYKLVETYYDEEVLQNIYRL